MRGLTRYRIWVLLVGLVLFGCFVRLLHVGDQSIRGDEAFTYVVLRAGDFWATLARDVHPCAVGLHALLFLRGRQRIMGMWLRMSVPMVNKSWIGFTPSNTSIRQR